ncbi:ATP-binding protein [Pedobacter steynii]
MGFNFWEAFPKWKSTACFTVVESALSEHRTLTHDFISEVALGWTRLTAVPENQGVILTFQPIIGLNEANDPDWKTNTQTDQFSGEIPSAYEARYRLVLAGKVGWRTTQLKHSEHRLRMFVSASSDMVYEMNADWTQMHQLKGKDFLADTEEPTHGWMERYIPLSEQARVQKAIHDAISNKSTFELEHEVLLADGGTGWTRSRAIPVLDEQGQIIEWFGTAKDITAIRAAEHKIRDMDARRHQEIVRVTLNTQEEERRRMSEHLHNGLGQLLYATKLSIDYLSHQMAVDMPEKFKEAQNYTRELLTDAINTCRNLSHELMPTVLGEFGLVTAVRDLCEQMNGGIKFHCKVDLATITLDKFMEIAVFRMVQELVINVIKHANATLTLVEIITEQDTMVIRVRDNGHGIQTGETSQPGIGLALIRTKAVLLKGEMEISTPPGQGTTVEVRLPLYLSDDISETNTSIN